MESLSPEERLLQLIRKRRHKKEEPSPLPKEGDRSPERPSPQGPRTLPQFLLHWKSFFRRERKLPKPALREGGGIFILKKTNQVLAIGFGALLSLSFFSFFWRPEPGHPKVQLDLQEVPKDAVSPGVEVKAPQKPYAYYGETLEKRNIFGPALYTEETTSPGGADVLREAVKELNLLGIISGKIPQAIIENKKEGKTHFVNPGDTIDGLRVEKIMEDKVILDYRGERLDLVL